MSKFKNLKLVNKAGTKCCNLTTAFGFACICESDFTFKYQTTKPKITIRENNNLLYVNTMQQLTIN